MKKGLTELVIIIDKSGSMSGLESDVVGGFNSLIKGQMKEEGEVIVSTIFFDTKQEVIHDRTDIKNIKPLEQGDYSPSGCTALLDTVGSAINHIKTLYKGLNEDAIPEHTIFSIMTDGLENSSREYSYKKVKTLIEKQKECGWDFIFQAANIDANEEGSKLGIDIDDIKEFDATPNGVKLHFRCCCASISEKRKGKKK